MRSLPIKMFLVLCVNSLWRPCVSLSSTWITLFSLVFLCVDDMNNLIYFIFRLPNGADGRRKVLPISASGRYLGLTDWMKLHWNFSSSKAIFQNEPNYWKSSLSTCTKIYSACSNSAFSVKHKVISEVSMLLAHCLCNNITHPYPLCAIDSSRVAAIDRHAE